MILTCIILIICLAAFATATVNYRSKFWNYFKFFNDLEKKFDEYKNELDENLIQAKKELEETLENQYSKKTEFIVSQRVKKIKDRYNLSSKKLKERYNLLVKNLEQDYNNACEEVKDELFKQLEKVDISIQEHAQNLALKNILTFSCSCSKELIPCPIDFTKENTFVCPRCGSKYKVAINANPILIGRAVSEEQFATLLEKRLNENKRKN